MNALVKSSITTVAIFIAALTCLRCASDQAATQQGGDVINEGADDSASSDASLNGTGSQSDAGSKAAEGAAMNNAVEGGSPNNFSSANQGTGNAPANNTALSNNATMGASLNNVPVENTTILDTPTNNLLSQSASPLNQSASTNTNVAPLNGVVPDQGAQSNVASSQADNNLATATGEIPNAAAAQPTDADHAARAAKSPFTNPHMNWPGKGKVKYATRQITRHSSPNGPVVGEFEQGEHPLVYQNGNWAELNDGTFVKGNGLSEKGVGYNKGKAH